MRMLFVPERHERGFDPNGEPFEVGGSGMASCAQCDEISSSVGTTSFRSDPQARQTAVIAV